MTSAVTKNHKRGSAKGKPHSAPNDSAFSKATVQDSGGNRASQSEKTPHLLLQAARELFYLKGYDGTSVKELADHAKVNVSLVSYYFGGKEGLLNTLLEQFGQERMAAAERMLQTPKSAEELRIRFRMFVEELLEAYVSDPQLVAIILRECEYGGAMPEKIFQERFFVVFLALEQFFKAAKKSGILRKEIDPHMLTFLSFGTVNNLVRSDPMHEKIFKQTLKDSHYRNKVVDQLMTLIFDGIVEKNTTSPDSA